MRRAITVALLAMLLSGCTVTGPAPIVDGWPVGERASCARLPCEAFIQTAAEALDQRDPGHAFVQSATVRDLGLLLDDQGQPQLLVYSGGQPSIVLFELADGTLSALGVKVVIGGDIGALAWGPALEYAAPPGR